MSSTVAAPPLENLLYEKKAFQAAAERNASRGWSGKAGPCS